MNTMRKKDRVTSEITLNHATCSFLRIAEREGNSRNISTKGAFKKGIVIIDENYHMIEYLDEKTVNLCINCHGSSPIEWSHTFHASLEKVANASYDQLAYEQALNYFSTYGLELLGCEARPFIPSEEIFKDAYETTSTRCIRVVKIVSHEALMETVDNYLKNTVNAANTSIVYLRAFAKASNVDIEDVKSYEIKCILYDIRGIVPERADEWMRFVVYQLTESACVIKDKNTIELLKKYAHEATKYLATADLKVLAESFHRYKPLYLALKTCKENAPYINKIRRLADKYHKPVGELTAQNIVNFYRHNEKEKLCEVLKKSSLRQLVKIYNYVASCDCEVGVYQIRNGKRHLDENRNTLTVVDIGNLRYLLRWEINNRVCYKLLGKKFYIPEYISYAVPVSEKQMVGNFPIGTKVSAGTDAFSIGICWDNYKNIRTDIDLHMTSAYGDSYGWNCGWRDSERAILYSGDMTSAGAEAFYVNKLDKYILSAVLFSGDNKCPFKFMVTEKKFRERNYSDTTPPITPQEAMFAPIDLQFDDGGREMFLGVLDNKDFYFYNGAVSSGRIPNRDLNAKYVDSVIAKLSNAMTIEELITLAGGEVVKERGDGVIDLSPSCLNSRSLLDIVDVE